MGEDALEFLNEPRVPALAARSTATLGELQRFTPDDRGARRPRHRPLARRAAREDTLLERLQAGRSLVGRAAALLIAVGALVAWFETAPHLVGALDLAERRARRARPDAGDVQPHLARPADLASGRCRSRSASPSLLGVVAPLLAARGAGARELREVRGGHAASGCCSCRPSRRSRGWSRSRLIIPWVDAYSVWRGPTQAITDAPPGGVHEALDRLRRAGRQRGAPRPARRDVLRALPRSERALRPAPVLDVARDDRPGSGRRSR